MYKTLLETNQYPIPFVQHYAGCLLNAYHTNRKMYIELTRTTSTSNLGYIWYPKSMYRTLKAQYMYKTYLMIKKIFESVGIYGLMAC